MPQKQITLPIHSLNKDNGDGSNTTYLFNTFQEVLEHVRDAHDLNEYTDDEIEDMIEDEPYEFGYHNEGSLKLLIDENNNITLNKNNRYCGGE